MPCGLSITYVTYMCYIRYVYICVIYVYIRYVPAAVGTFEQTGQGSTYTLQNPVFKPLLT
jgi:hypothetical protein